MRYNLNGYDQEMVVKLDLDLIDLTLMGWLRDFKATGKMISKIIGGKKLYWVIYKSVLEEFPIFGFKSIDSVYRRFKKLADKGILIHETVKKNGTYSYYAFGDVYEKLLPKKRVEKNSNVDTDITQKGTDTNPNQTILRSNLSYSSSSKGERPFLPTQLEMVKIKFFENNICKLTRNTSSKLLSVIKTQDTELIESILSYCIEYEAKSYSYFESIVDSCIEKHISEPKAFEESIKEFRKSNKTKRNKARKEKLGAIKNTSEKAKKVIKFKNHEERDYSKDEFDDMYDDPRTVFC